VTQRPVGLLFSFHLIAEEADVDFVAVAFEHSRMILKQTVAARFGERQPGRGDTPEVGHFSTVKNGPLHGPL
jgi:hypothetical protein